MPGPLTSPVTAGPSSSPCPIDFSVNELVSVGLNPGLRAGAGGTVLPYQYRFVVSTHLPNSGLSTAQGDNAPAAASVSAEPGGNSTRPRPWRAASPAIRPMLTTKATMMPNGVSVPTGFPLITITTNNNPDPEYIFIDNRGGNGSPYNVIFDNSGSPVWYQLMPDERRDMKVQHNGVLTMLARTGGYRFVGLNTNYVRSPATDGQRLRRRRARTAGAGGWNLLSHWAGSANGGHEPLRPRRQSSTASVTEECIQEFTPAGELIFQWRAWDHLDVAGPAIRR